MSLTDSTDLPLAAVPPSRQPLSLSRRQLWIAGAVVFLIALGLRVSAIRHQGLWADEIFSLAMATGHSLEQPADRSDPAMGDFVQGDAPMPPSHWQTYLSHGKSPQSISNVIRAVFLSDTSPPLYYVLLYGWTRMIGATDFALKSFSLLFAMACFPLIWSIARQVGGRAASLPAVALYAVAPFSLYYTIEGRMYSLLWFCTLASIWLTLRLHRRGLRPITFALWILACTAGMLTHYFFSFVLLAIGGWLMLCPGRVKRSAVIVGGIVICLLILPWYLKFPASTHNWRITQGWLNKRPDNFRPLNAIGHYCWSYFTGEGEWGGNLSGDKIVFAGILLLILLNLVRGHARAMLFSRRRLLIWMVVIGAIFGPIVLDKIQGTYLITKYRYASAGLTAALILVGAAMARVPVLMRVLLLIVIFGGWFSISKTIVRRDTHAWEPFREIGKTFMRETSRDDAIIIHSIPSGLLGITRYMRPQTDKTAMVASWCGQLGGREVPRDLERFAAGKRRIVLIKIHDLWAKPEHELWLKENAKLEQETWKGIGQIFYFVPREGEVFFPTGDQQPAATTTSTTQP